MVYFWVSLESYMPQSLFSFFELVYVSDDPLNLLSDPVKQQMTL